MWSQRCGTGLEMRLTDALGISHRGRNAAKRRLFGDGLHNVEPSSDEKDDTRVSELSCYPSVKTFDSDEFNVHQINTQNSQVFGEIGSLTCDPQISKPKLFQQANAEP
ncbi:hypothetical protein AVEN_187060-1 [Araneus ventricosus]|uniref:Uncharacterized protein n=1 Tax=Araneus ventricosus TaxID=182803 RepID=A0A4Y2P485_ARAVE|nr:hypothetical protein AVEN_187060-1 [Araneus ventricosus]